MEMVLVTRPGGDVFKFQVLPTDITDIIIVPSQKQQIPASKEDVYGPNELPETV
jgi:hypothetical protein